MSGCAWAFARALRYAIATSIVALLAATVLPGADAERFATTAYIAAIAAAVILAITWFLPPAPRGAPAAGAPFPRIFAFAVGVTTLLMLGAALVAQPGAEVIALLACFAAIGLAALLHGGAVSALHGKLSRGGRLSAASRYAVLAALLSLGAAALLSSQGPEGFARFAYAAIVAAAVAVAASLLAPTRAGVAAAAACARGGALLQTSAGAFVLERAAECAVASAVAALILAAFLPQPYAERFATTAYAATLFAAIAVGANWRLARIGVKSDSPAQQSRGALRFAAPVAAVLVVGSAAASSPVAETLAVCAALCAVGIAVFRRAGASTER